MFISHNQVRIHDTDLSGVIFFAKQFRWVSDALEDFCSSEGFSIDHVVHHENLYLLVVHAEADFIAPLIIGDKLEIHVAIESIGTSSFTVAYHIYKIKDKTLAGRAKTVHVTLDIATKKKVPIPEHLRIVLEKHK